MTDVQGAHVDLDEFRQGVGRQEIFNSRFRCWSSPPLVTPTGVPMKWMGTSTVSLLSMRTS